LNQNRNFNMAKACTPPGEVRRSPTGTAFGCPRDFHENRFVYTVISPRARGLSIGVNMNPDKHCNFDCSYCEVSREVPATESRLDIEAMVTELQETIQSVWSGKIRELPFYRGLPLELLQLRHVALSGDGEPTLCPNFTQVVEAIIHLRSRCHIPFNLVLVTNSSGLTLPGVEEGLRHFAPRDEIWVKLDGGTQEYLGRVNKIDDSIDSILAKILHVGRQRPVIIQSLFPAIDGAGPCPSEIEEYATRLKELKDGGAAIALVQIYSATRPTHHAECGHLPLRTLSAIAKRVREVAGLKAEVF
jgi:wyosine [tRNA(Phe)-imidazoG37] synthetase (radical SAM superfamily)